MKNKKNSTGRLKQALDPIAHAIAFPVKQGATLIKELSMHAILNEAHLISLHKSKLLPLPIVTKLLKSISRLKKENFSALLHRPTERGSYFLFENYLIETLGMKTAGSMHIGRSRNDINATIFKLNLRNFYKDIYSNLCRLRSTLLRQANKYMSLAMPIYSQFQVAQVGTYAYYLLAIEEALARDQYCLQTLFVLLDECPIGAASGCGTSFPTDSKLTANLLGFSHNCKNALDAVANRDLALRLLSTLAVMATTLCRMAQDYQLWTTQEFAFFDLPDTLCGGSSMMPQKKNPYVLEIVKGKSASINGMLVQALTSMHNVPFSNSLEVGTEALQGIDVALTNMCDILILSNLLVSNALPVESQCIKSIHKGTGIAAGVAEFLVKDNDLTFREAHYKIGEIISQAISNHTDPTNEVFKLAGNELSNHAALFWAAINEYGGGPGKQSTKKAYQRAERRLNKETAWIKSIEKKWQIAEKKLQYEIKRLCKYKDK